MFYFSFETVPQDKQERFVKVLSFILSSMSSQEVVEYCTPIPVAKNLYRIDTRQLKWNVNTIHKVLACTPYKRHLTKGAVLINDPMWFIVHVSDATQSTAYNELLFGKPKPSREDYLQFFKTNDDPTYRIGYVEGSSGVSVQRSRWLHNFPNGVRTDVWGTMDFLKVTEDNDPLSNLDYPIKRWKDSPTHDGEEWIAGLPKVSIASRERGRLQAYALFNGKGQNVAEAPGRLVRDSEQFRNHGVIVNFGGCIVCHTTGLNPLTKDVVREYLISGATISTKRKEDSQAIDQLVLSPTERLILQANEDYERGVQMVSGFKPTELSAAYIEAVDWYDTDVSLEQAAVELYTTAEELKLAIAWREAKYNDLHPRQASLAQNVPIPRTVWEGLYSKTFHILEEWRTIYVQEVPVVPDAVVPSVKPVDSGTPVSESRPSPASPNPVSSGPSTRSKGSRFLRRRR